MYKTCKVKIDCEILYKSGMQNSNVDALSRIVTLTKEGNEFDELDPDMNVRILQEIHHLILGGYGVMIKTYKAIKRYYE